MKKLPEPARGPDRVNLLYWILKDVAMRLERRSFINDFMSLVRRAPRVRVVRIG